MTTNLFDLLRRAVGATGRRADRPAARPRLSALEGRDVPAVFTLFDTAAPVPAPVATFDRLPVTLGVEFTVDVPGTVDRVRFYRGDGAQIAGGYDAALWRVNPDGTGALLAEGRVVEGQQPTPNWQTVFLGAVPVVPGERYVASYFASQGGYSFSHGFFDGPGVDVGPLNAVPSGGRPNGVFVYGDDPTAFPRQVYRTSNYWVTPVFDADIPAVTGLSRATAPAGGLVGPDRQVTVTGTDLRAGLAAGDQPRVFFGGAEATVVSSTDTAVRVVVPAAAEPGTVAVRVVTPNGASADTPADDFRYAAAATAFPPDATPATPVWPNDTRPVELGVRFRVDTAGTLDAIRFYRGAGLTDQYTVTLYDEATGQVVATAVGTADGRAGWQTVALGDGVRLAAGKTYVATYFTASGNYAADNFGLTDPQTGGPVTLLGGGSVYRYGAYAPAAGDPTDHFRDNNYFVDVVFLAD